MIVIIIIIVIIVMIVIIKIINSIIDILGLFRPLTAISSHVHIHLNHYTGCSKKSDKKKKIISKIDCCGAKFYHGHDSGALDPAES